MIDTQRTRRKMIQDPLGLYTVEFEMDPRSTALLIIDMQKHGCCRDIGRGPLYLKKMPEMAKYWFPRLEEIVVPNIQKLLVFFRGNQRRVMYACVGPLLPDGSDLIPRRLARDKNWLKATGMDHLFYPGTLEHEVIDDIKPQQGELVFHKNSSSAFNSSNIDQILRNMRIEGLVITGMATNACVELTARDAADRGYNCILVDDACAARSQDFHDMTMANFATTSGKVMTTKEVIGYLSTTPSSTKNR